MSTIGTGTLLRVNLSDGTTTTEDSAAYKDFLGGAGLGLKVLFDEVPGGTEPASEQNKLIFAAGPLVGTGTLAAAVTTVTSLTPALGGDASTGRMCGRFGAQMKYAGYDAIILEGKSELPVWVRIQDDQVSLESAAYLWGTGIRNATAQICATMGRQAAVAAIGPAGEHQVNLSIIASSGGHSAGGHGCVMGAKNVKAIAIIGTGGLACPDTKAMLDKHTQTVEKLLGAPDGWVVPAEKQDWSPYSDESSRWNAGKSLTWGAAKPQPVELGVCAFGDKVKAGLRCQNAVAELGALAQQYTVKMAACPCCPTPCVACLRIPKLEQFGVSPYLSTSSETLAAAKELMPACADVAEKGDGPLFGAAVAAALADDFGVWLADGQLGRDFRWALESGTLEKKLGSAAKLESYQKGDPSFFADFFRQIAQSSGDFAPFGGGSLKLAESWELGDGYYLDAKTSPLSTWTGGTTQSRLSGTAAVVETLFPGESAAWPMIHFQNCGLPAEELERLSADFGGGDGIPLARWSLLRHAIVDMLGLCGHLWPMAVSPDKESGFAGNTALEAEYLTLATGESVTEAQLMEAAQRVVNLRRALSALYRGAEKAGGFADLSGWFYSGEGAPMTKEAAQGLFTQLYEAMGWDKATGIPTADTLEKLGLGDVAQALKDGAAAG